MGAAIGLLRVAAAVLLAAALQAAAVDKDRNFYAKMHFEPVAVVVVFVVVVVRRGWLRRKYAVDREFCVGRMLPGCHTGP